MKQMKEKPMISKDTFCKALELIREQESADIDFSKALQKVGDGCFVFGVKNKYQEALLLVLAEAMNDKYEYISWWLYDATDNYEVSLPNGDKKWCLKEPGALYDFIANECD